MSSIDNRIHSDEEGMLAALSEAEKAFSLGEIPIGAILVDQEGNIISRSHNLCETNSDATAHAEILALRQAGEILQSWRLSQHTLYVTLEPCSMCAGALVNSRLKRLVYGAPDWRAGGCDSVFNITTNSWLNHQVEVRGGVLEDECKSILRKFFSLHR